MMACARLQRGNQFNFRALAGRASIITCMMFLAVYFTAFNRHSDFAFGEQDACATSLADFAGRGRPSLLMRNSCGGSWLNQASLYGFQVQ